MGHTRRSSRFGGVQRYPLIFVVPPNPCPTGTSMMQSAPQKRVLLLLLLLLERVEAIQSDG